jgi:hypothetical protein
MSLGIYRAVWLDRAGAKQRPCWFSPAGHSLTLQARRNGAAPSPNSTIRSQQFPAAPLRWRLAVRQTMLALLCAAVLAGCSSGSPNFAKLDAAGKLDLSANSETLQRDLADCKVVEDHVRVEAGTVFNTSSARMALDNCMRSKGYVKS